MREVASTVAVVRGAMFAVVSISAQNWPSFFGTAAKEYAMRIRDATDSRVIRFIFRVLRARPSGHILVLGYPAVAISKIIGIAFWPSTPARFEASSPASVITETKPTPLACIRPRAACSVRALMPPHASITTNIR